MEDREITIQTPIGSITSDSGSHMVDCITIGFVILVLIVGKKIMGYIVK